MKWKSKLTRNMEASHSGCHKWSVTRQQLDSLLLLSVTAVSAESPTVLIKNPKSVTRPRPLKSAFETGLETETDLQHCNTGVRWLCAVLLPGPTCPRGPSETRWSTQTLWRRWSRGGSVTRTWRRSSAPSTSSTSWTEREVCYCVCNCVCVCVLDWSVNLVSGWLICRWAVWSNQSELK